MNDSSYKYIIQVHTCTFIEYKHTHTHTQVYVLADRETDRQTCYVLLLTLSLASMAAPPTSSSITTSEWPLAAAHSRAVIPSWYQCDYWIIVHIVSQSAALCVTSHNNTQISSYYIRQYSII